MKNINNILELKDLKIIFEDEFIIAINKPAGLLTLPDRYNHNLPSLYKILKNHYENIFSVHRLDVGTSGVILFAKDANTHKILNEQFAEHSIEKFYLAVTQGAIHKNNFEIDIPLLLNNKLAAVVPSVRGKYSLTIIDVIERFNNATLVKAQLKTGRQHQLRVHCAAIGHPLLVDDLYGNQSQFFISSIKKRFNLKKGTEEKPIISRPTLHAQEITFLHPNNSKITLQAQMPKDFSALLQILRKYS